MEQNVQAASIPATAAISAPAKRLHPLIALAAVSVTVASVLAAVALITTQVSAQHDDSTHQKNVVTTVSDAAQTAAPPSANTGTSNNKTPSKTASTAANPPRATANTHNEVASNSTASQSTYTSSSTPTAPVAPPSCYDCGVVSDVREVKVAGQGSGAGAVAGGVVGGVLGNQVGKGNGRDAARILGALGGAVAGHQIEKQVRASVRYDVELRMEDGSFRTVSFNSRPQVQIGERVRVNGNALTPV